MIYNIIDFGAVSDGKTMNTAAIQNAIDKCSETGGRVIVPAGTFMSGSIELKSNVDFHLEQGAHLLASDKLEDYNDEDAYVQNWSGIDEGWKGKHFIFCVEQENVSITGLGMIDGNATAFFEENTGVTMLHNWRLGFAREKDKVNLRPGQMVVFMECKNIRVEDVTMTQSPCWTLFFHGCEYVQATRLKIKNTYYHANTDGIDIDTCRYVTISDCIIRTGDDAITFRGAGKRLKSGKACEYITVNNCILSSSAAAFRIGVGTYPIRHIQVANITICFAGVAFCFHPEWAGTGATPIDDLSITNISVSNVALLWELHVDNGTKVSNLRFCNVHAETMNAFMFRISKMNCIRNIFFRDIYIRAIEDTVSLTKDAQFPFVHLENIENLCIENMQLDISEEIRANMNKLIYSQGMGEESLAAIKYLKQ